MTSSRDILTEAIAKAIVPLEELTQSSIARAQEEQSAILLKMNALILELDQIEKSLPASDLDPLTDAINSLCSRMESCSKRIQAVIKRANWMNKRLDARPPTIAKTTNFIDVS